MTNPTSKTELNLFVTHMDADGPLLRIWAQTNRDDVIIVETLLHRLTPQFDKGINCPLLPQSRTVWPNVICCAMFDRVYFRAKISSIHHTGNYLVQFIDYGNTEIVKPSDVRLIDGIPEAADLQRIPPLATDFIIADVLPRNCLWESKVQGGILQDIRYNECPAKIIGVVGKYRLIRMLYGDRDFAEILLDQNLAVASNAEQMFRAHACFQQSQCQQPQIQIPKPSMQIPVQTQPAVRENPSRKYFTPEPIIPLRVPRTQHYQESWRAQSHQNVSPSVKIQSSQQNDDAGVFRSRILEIGSKHEIKVSYVEDGPLMFSVQVNSTLDELNNLMYHINQTHTPQPLVEPPVIGSVCLGRYSADKSLLRAVVMQVREHDCKVHYVDFGHSEILPYTDIYQLPRQYINPRVLSIRFTMSNVNELRVSDEMKEYFKNYVAGKTLLLHVRPFEGSPLIQYGELYDNGRNIKDLLRAKFGDAVTPWTSARKLTPDSREIVHVAYTALPIIFVQLDSDLSSLESLIDQIDEYVPTAPPFKPSQLAKGLQCIALSGVDSQWYRAEIVNVSGDNVTVYYVDYGNEETIPATSIRSIRDNKITKIRAQAIRCILNDYEKEMTTKELQDSLEAEIMATPVAMIVTKVTPAGPIVDLYDSNVEPLVNIIQKLKRASVVNGNVDSKSENYNDRNINSTHSNINRRFNVKKQSTVGQHQKSKSQNVNAARDDQTNKWNHTPRSEPPRIPESSNSMERGKSHNWKNEENEPKRYENRDNRYQNRDKEWSPNSGQQNDRYSRNDGKNERSTREVPRYERNERFDRSGESNSSARGGRDNRDRGGRGNYGNSRYSGNTPRTERNGSVEKAWSDKDSDSSSRSSGRGGRRGARGSGGRGRRDNGRTSNIRDSDGDSDRGNFKNVRTNGASSRIRENRRDFGDKYKSKEFDAPTNKTPPISKKIGIPLPNIMVGAVKNCEIVYVNNPGDFHVQLIPDNSELEPVMASIAAIYENDGKILPKSSIKQGMDCIAQYSEDEKWYRANVQSIENNGATVRFVDFGNLETVDFSKIKELEADYAKLSAQAIACKLLAAKKTTWNNDDIDKFNQIISDKCLEAEFVVNNNDVFEILLREVIDEKTFGNYINEEFSDGADLAEAKNNARFKGRQKHVEIVTPTNYAAIDEKWTAEDIIPGTKQNIIITWFTNPENFYCQTLAKKDEFRAMMNEIQRIYATRQPINEPLQVGSAVMAVFSDDGALYRAEILELNKARGNIVRYIDFGNTAMVEQRNTYRVEKKFMNIPKQAVNCSLKNIVPANGTSWAKSNKQEIEKYFDAENFECTFHEMKDGKYIISLSNGDVDVAGLLVEKSVASFAVSAHNHVDKNEVEATEKLEIEELPRFDISLLAGQVLRVKVSNVESAAKFHIQLPSANASERIIDAYMAQNDQKVMPRLSCREVCLGAGCLVNTDEGWRRAVVVNCSRTTGFDVRFIDTGANDEIPLDCMLALPGQLSVMQNQAVECCLKNPITNIVLDEQLRDRIENTIVIVAVEEVDNNRLIVKLYDTNGKNIKLSNEEKDDNICPICPMPILYSTQTVVVSHAENSSSVWLKRKAELTADADLITELYDHYGNSSEDDNKKLSTTEGTLCAAKSITDENWYRAKIIKTTDTGAMVHYIDYGNNENVPSECLRVLEPQFYVRPQLAIETALTVTLGGPTEQQQEILNAHILNNEYTATLYNVHKKWIAELTNSDGKISEKLSKLEEVETSKNRHVQTVIPEMRVGERYKVICHHADSPASFWLQRTEEIPAIEEFQEKLQIDAANCPTLEGIPDENTLCLAMYSVDDMWYRAEVIIADPEITSVRFIDFGNTDIVYTNQGKSKKITDSLKSIKRYAIKCRLDVIPYGSEDWTTAANEWFKSIVTSVENMEALVIADSTPRRVELFAGEKSIVDDLVQRNYATKINTEEDLIEEIIEREVDPRAAYVSHAISPSEFWVQQEKYVGDLEILADRFIVADMFPKPKDIAEGLLCVAKFPEDESWYRARVVSHGDTGTEVIYIDYGNSAISTEIREIPEDVAVQPAFSKKCSLVMPEGVEQWSEEACIEFVKMAAEGATIFQLDVIEERDDTSIVRLTQDGKDIVENLIQLCSPRLPVIEERLSPLGEENSPNVFISHANSPSEFFIQAESSINELEVMAEHLAAAESFLTLEKIEEGLICAAKFPEDEQWYRAKILSHGDAGTEVLYIDYGNSAVTTELRVLPEDIVQISELSTCCSLLMPDYLESWSKEACEKFFELANQGITMFQYEILEEKEQTIVRLSINGNDIVDILSPLCTKKTIKDSTSLGTTESLKINKNEIQKEIVDNTVTEISSLEIDQRSMEINATHEETFRKERISSNETSGVDMLTISEISTADSSSKSETSMKSSAEILESKNQEKIISDDTGSNLETTEVSNVEKVIDVEKDLEKASSIAKIVEEASNMKKVIKEVSSTEKVIEEVVAEVSSMQKVIEEVPSTEKDVAEILNTENVVAEVSSMKKSVKEFPSAEKVVAEVLSVEKVIAEVPNTDKVVTEISSMQKDVEEAPSTEKFDAEIPNAEKVVAEISSIEKVVEKVPSTEKVVAKVPSTEKVVAEILSMEKDIEEVPNTEKDVAKVLNTENVAAEVRNTEKVVAEVSSMKKSVEEFPSAEKVVEEVPSTKKVDAEVSNMKKGIDEISSKEKVSEPIETTVENEKSNEKVAECKEFVSETNSQDVAIVNEKIIPKIPRTEKILPGTIFRELSEEDILLDNERRDSVSLERKIVPCSVNSSKDLIIENSSLVVNKLSCDEKIIPVSDIVDNSTNKQLESSETPKISHSEKIVVSVTNPQEKIQEIEKDEILTDVTDENIPK